MKCEYWANLLQIQTIRLHKIHSIDRMIFCQSDLHIL